MGNKPDKFHICYSSDNRYAPYMGISIDSLLKNAVDKDKYFFHILDGGISEKNKKELKTLTGNIKFYEIPKSLFEGFSPNRPYISLNTYYRFLIPELFDKSIDSCLYLDCDTLVLDDLTDLFQQEIGAYNALVVEDEGSLTQIKRLNLPKENNYFNAGVILFNLKELRKYDFKNECMNFYRNNKEIICLEDQDVLNSILNGKCKFIALRYNSNNRIFTGNELENFYTENEIKEATENPAILHFTDCVKPWDKNCIHPLKNTYCGYWKNSPWKREYFSYLIKRLLYQIKMQKKKIISLKINKNEISLKIFSHNVIQKYFNS